MSVPEDSSGSLKRATCFRSENFARADFTCASSRISCSTPQSAAAAGIPAARASAPIHARSTGLTPVIIEIEPVIRRQPAIVLEPRGVALERVLDRAFAIRAGDPAHVGQPLEMDIVAAAAAVDAEH